jgi:hypothetical protein
MNQSAKLVSSQQAKPRNDYDTYVFVSGDLLTVYVTTQQILH